MGKLFIGSEANGLLADDRIVVALHAAIGTVIERFGEATIVSEELLEDGVATHAAFVNPTDPEYGRCWFELEGGEDLPIDAKYVERALECAEHTHSWIVLDACDEVVTDRVKANEIQRRAVRERHRKHGL